MNKTELRVGTTVRRPVFPEPVEILVVQVLGSDVKVTGAGKNMGQVHQRVLTEAQLENLTASPETEPFDGDAARFRLGVEAMRLGLAHEHDPY